MAHLLGCGLEREPTGTSLDAPRVHQTVAALGIDDGLVAYYPFEAVSATVTPDASGFGNHAAVVGAVQTAGRIGSAVEFDGVDDMLRVADAPSLAFTTQMTLAAWVRPAWGASDLEWRVLMTREGDFWDDWYLAALDGGDPPSFSVDLNGDGIPDPEELVLGSDLLAVGVWSHVAATYNGFEIRLYVNGQLAVTQYAPSGTIPNSGNDITIGGSDFWGDYLLGGVDEVRIYDRALSEGEIAVLAQMNAAPVADAGPDRRLALVAGSTTAVATLDGTGSYDLDGAITAYTWTREQTVVGTTSTAAVTLEEGVHNLMLTVADAQGLTGRDRVTITVGAAGTLPTDGLVAYFPFETVGATTPDASGSGNDATVSGASTASGRIGNGLEFDGVNDVLRVSDSPSLTFLTGLTLAAWVRPAWPDVRYQTLMVRHSDDGWIDWYLPGLEDLGGGDAAPASFWMELNGDAAADFDELAAGTVALQVGVWSHVAATYDGSELRMYVDGQLSAIQYHPGGTIRNSSNDITIGGSDEWGEYLVGRLDEVRIYNRGLSEGEIAILADIGVKPIADAGPDQTLSDADRSGSELVTLDASGSEDPDGSIVSFVWREGSAVLGATSTVTVAFDVGVHLVELWVTDDSGQESMDTLRMTVGAPPQLVTTPPGVATEGVVYSVLIEATDADVNDTLTFSLPLAPAGMTIDPASGLLTWTPSAAQVGPHDVTIRVDDTRQGFDTLTYAVTVQNVNDPPVLIGALPNTALEGQLLTFDFDVMDPDAGDTATFSLPSAPSGASIVATSGVFSWTPTNAQVGANEVVVAVTDGVGATGTSTFTVTVIDSNEPPVFTSSPVINAREDTAYQYAATASDPDVGDELTFALRTKPMGMAVNPQSGVISWTPTNAQVGTTNVTVEVSDGLAAVEQSFTVTVANENDAPVITTTGPTSATEGATYTYDVDATDEDVGDTLTFAVDGGPAGMTIDPQSGLVTWTPDADHGGGSVSYTVRVTDPAGGAATESITVSVANVNDPPRFTSTPPNTAVAGQPFQYVPTVEDPDPNETLAYAVESSVPGFAVEPTTGAVSWTPLESIAGLVSATLTVTDSGGATDQQTLSIDVQNFNDPPIFLSAAPSTGTQGVLYTYAPVVEDPDPNDILTFTFDETPPLGMTVDPLSGLVDWTPTSDQVGLFDVILRVTDSGGAFDLQLFTVVVVNANDPPVIVSSVLPDAAEHQPYSHVVVVNDPDIGDALTFSLTTDRPGLRIDPATGALSWIPGAADVGTHSATVRVEDQELAFDTQVLSLTVVSGGAACTGEDTSARCSAVGWTYAVRSDSVPLGGVSVSQIGPQGAAVLASANDSGLTTLGGVAGGYEWLLSAAGHVPVYGARTLVDDRISWVAVPWMAPLTDIVGPLGASESRLADVNGRVELVFPIGSVSQTTTVSVALLNGQSLPGHLPRGWSSAAALWYELGDGATLAQSPTATFTMPAPIPVVSDPPLEVAPVYLAQWNHGLSAWTSMGPVIVPNPTEPFPVVTVTLGAPGGYALLVADIGETAPAVPATVNDPFPAATAGLQPATPLVDSQVNPEWQSASQSAAEVTATARVQVAAAGAVASGLVLPARLYERYVFGDGQQTEVPTMDFSVALYQYPPAGLATPGAVSATFPVRPRFILGPTERVDVHQRVEVAAELAFVGAPLDAAGGLVSTGTVSLSVPPGAFAGPTLISVDDVSTVDAVVDEVTPVLAFRTTWSGTADQALTLQTPTVGANGHFVLARRVLEDIQVGWQPVQRFTSDASGALTSAEVAPNTLPGLRVPGVYALFEVSAPQGLVQGTVRRSGQPTAGATVEVTGTPWKQVTDGNGAFASLGYVGPVVAVAQLAGSSDTGMATGTLSSPTGAVALDITLGAQPPQVVRMRPADTSTDASVLAAIEIDFSEPIAAESVSDDAVVVQFVDAQAQAAVVAGVASLDIARRRLTFLPDTELPAATLLTVTVSDQLTDDDGALLSGNRIFSFTTKAAPARSTVAARLTSYAPGSLNSPCSGYDPQQVGPDFDPTGDPNPVPGFDATDLAFSCVVGAAGVADPGVPVVLINESTGQTFTVTARSNGSFKSFMRAAEEDLLAATFINDNGTTVSVPLERQLFDDGSVGLYASGGIVEATNPLGGAPLELIVEAGAISRRTVFKMSGLTSQDIDERSASTPPERGTVILGGTITAKGDPLQASADVRFPIAESDLQLPEGVTATTAGYLVVGLRPTIVDGLEVMTYEPIDRMKYEDGALATHSHPMRGFEGSVFASDFAVLSLANRPVALTGYAVACDVNVADDCVRAGVAPPPGRRLQQAEILAIQPTGSVSGPVAIQAGAFVALTDQEGRYALTVPGIVGAAYNVRGRHPDFPGGSAAARSDVDQRLSLAGSGSAHVIFDESTAVNSPPPQLMVSTTPGSPAVFTGTGTPQSHEQALVRATASHPDPGVQIAPFVIQSVTRLSDGSSAPSALTRVTLPTPPPPSGSLTAERHERWTASEPVRVRMQVQASGGGRSTEQSHVVTFGGAAPGVSPGGVVPEPGGDQTGPWVLSSDPTEGARAVQPGAPIRLRFSEPIKDFQVTDRVSMVPAAPLASYVFNAQRTELTLSFGALQPGQTYTLTVGPLLDDNNNELNQLPGSVGPSGTPVHVPFVVSFETAARYSVQAQSQQQGGGTTSPVGNPLSGIGRPGDAVVHGGYAYVTDLATEEVKVVEVLGSGTTAAGPTATITPRKGYPRGLVIIPDFSWVKPLLPGQTGCTGPGETPWTRAVNRGAPSTATPGVTPVPVTAACLVSDRTLLVVVAGLVRGTASDVVGGQDLEIYDVTDVGPTSPPRFVERGLLTNDPSSAVGRLRWSPPNLGYIQWTLSGEFLNVIDLHTWLFYEAMSTTQRAAMPSYDDPQRLGVDANGDGDYVDANDRIPLPPRAEGGVVGLGFGGLEQRVIVADTQQPILDYDLSGGPSPSIVAALGRYGSESSSLRVLVRDGTSVPRTVGDEVLPGSTSGTWSTQATKFFPEITLRVRSGAELQTVEAGQVYPLPLLIAAQSRGAEQRLFLLDATSTQSTPVLIGDQTNGVRLPPIGPVTSIEYDDTDAQHIRVVGANSVAFLDINRLTMASPTAPGEIHPAIADVVTQVGSSKAAHGATSFGIFVPPEKKDFVFAGPRMVLATFPSETRVVHPLDVKRTLSGNAVEDRFHAILSGMQSESHLRPARVHTTGPYPDQCDSLDRNFHVVLYAPGGLADQSSGELSLHYEGLNAGAHPRPNLSPGFAPVRAGDSGTLGRINRTARTNAPDLLPFKAYRLSDDRSSELYNVFISDPFVVTYEGVTNQEYTSMTQLAGNSQDRRLIFTSTPWSRFTLDPSNGHAALTAFKSRVQSNAFVPGQMLRVDGFDTHRILGPNPAPLTGATLARGSQGMLSVHNGEMRLRASDIHAPGVGMQTVFDRAYNGQDLGFGAMGDGWTHVYAQRVVELRAEHFRPGEEMVLVFRNKQQYPDTVAKDRDVLFHDGRGAVVHYKRFEGTGVPPEYQQDPLIAANGWSDRITEWYVPEEGRFDGLFKLDTEHFVRLTPDGMQYWYSADGRLLKIYDRFESNKHELRYNTQGELTAVIDATQTFDEERGLFFGYYRGAGATGIDKAASSPGREGLLATVVAQSGLGGTRRVDLRYSADGQLEHVDGVQDTQQRRHTVTYDWGRLSTDRSGIAAVYDLGGSVPRFAVSPGDLTTMAISSGRGIQGAVQLSGLGNNRASGPTPAVTVSYAQGSEVLEFDGRARNTVVRMQPNGVTGTLERRVAYAANGLVERVTHPRGNADEYAYDLSLPLRSRANVIDRIRDPGSVTTGQATLTQETSQYDLHYNLPSGQQLDADRRAHTVTLSSDFKTVQSRDYGASGSEQTSHDAYGRLTSRTSPTGVEETYSYQATGGFLDRSSRGAIDTTLDYTLGPDGEWGLPSSRSLPGLSPVQMTYDGRGNLLTRSDGTNLTTHTLDVLGRVTVVQEEIGGPGATLREEAFVYRPDGFMEQRVLRQIETRGTQEDLEWTYAADSMLRTIGVTGPGASATMSYDGLSRLTSRTAGGYTQAYTYDGNGNLIASGDDSESVRWQTAYDGLDRPVVRTNPLGQTTRYTYSPTDVQTGVVVDGPNGPLYSSEVLSYDLLGRATEVDVGDVTRYSVSHPVATQRTRTVTDQGGYSRSTMFDSAGQMLGDQVLGGYQLDRSYTSAGLVRSESVTPDGSGTETTYFDYNGLGHVTGEYDDAGQMTAQVEYTPRGDGLPTSVVRGGTAVTTYGYSSLGETLSMTKVGGATTRYEYDGERNVSAVGPLGALRAFTHDAANRLDSMTLANGTEYDYQDHDPRGLPRRIEIGGASSVTLAYDVLGRVTGREATASGPTMVASAGEQYGYDALGRLTSATTPQSGLVHEYLDQVGGDRRSTLTVSGAGSFVVTSTTYVNQSLRQLGYPSGVDVSYGRNGAGRLEDVIPSSGDPIVYSASYGASSMQMNLGPAGLIQREDLYDSPRRRLRVRRYTVGGQVRAELRFDYDSADREIARQYVHMGGRTDLFTYDSASRLKDMEVRALPVPAGTPSAWPLATSPSSGTWVAGAYGRTLQLDSGDRLLGSLLRTAPGETVPAFASSVNASYSMGHPEVVDGQGRTFDAFGNVTFLHTSHGPTQLSYDAFNRLRRLERPIALGGDGTTIDYEYRADDVLLRRLVNCSASAKASGACVDADRVYVYDGLLLLEEWELSSGALKVVARYYYADEGDIPIAMDLDTGGGPQRYYAVTDRMGSVVGLLDDAGSWAERVRYDPFGRASYQVADVLGPAVHRVELDSNGDVLVVFSEPVQASFTGGSGTGISGAVASIAGALSVTDTSGAVAGTMTLDPRAAMQPTYPRGTVVRFSPGAAIQGAFTVDVAAGALVDDWGNGTQTVSVAGGYVGAGLGSTASAAGPRSTVGNGLGFQAHLHDFDADLILMRARVFDPGVGQFLQADPVGHEDSVNLYSGMRWNSVTWRDPLGGQAEDEPIYMPETAGDIARLPDGAVFESDGWLYIKVDGQIYALKGDRDHITCVAAGLRWGLRQRDVEERCRAAALGKSAAWWLLGAPGYFGGVASKSKLGKRAVRTIGPKVTVATAKALVRYLQSPGALRRLAIMVHSLAKGIARQMSAVIVAEVRLATGEITYFATGSGGRLSIAQQQLLMEFGVPAENILKGVKVTKGYSKLEKHGERIIKRSIPEGSKVVRWGISWTTSQRGIPCKNCRPYIIEAKEILERHP